MALRDASFLLVGLLLLHTWGAWADVQVNMEDKVEVMLRETAQIACMFTSDDGIGAMIIQWFYVTRLGEKERIYYRDATMNIVDRGTPFSDRISVNGSIDAGEMVLTIKDVMLEDELEFICLVKSLTDGTAEGRTKLRVFESPDLPTIEGVKTGISVEESYPSKIGTCEVKNGYPKPNVTWYRNNTPLRSVPDELSVASSVTIESSSLYSVESELMMKVTKEDKDAEFYCEVTYFVPGATRMTETSHINVTVYYPHDAVNIWVASPPGKAKEGDNLELRCEGDGNTQSALFTITHMETGDSWETSKLKLFNVSRLNSGLYECQSFDPEFPANSLTHNTSLLVHYLAPAVVTPGESMEVDQGEQLQATCNALTSLPSSVSWFKDGEHVSNDHRLIIDNVTFDTSGTYECVVTVPEIEGMSTSTRVQVNVAGPPRIVEEDADIEIYNKSVQLKCHAIGYPVPEMSWTTSDGKQEDALFLTETEMGYESVFTVEVSSNVTVVCQASNRYGTDTVTFNIKAITHTTTPATTTPTISSIRVVTESIIPSKKVAQGSNGVIIAVIITCILLLAILGAVLYFLYKKGKICGRSGKQDLTKGKSSKDNIVVEMKSDNTEEAILLGVNGEKQPPNGQ